MFCPKCGKILPDGTEKCTNCGRDFRPKPSPQSHPNYYVYDIPKTALGVVMALFLGIIGLIIGVCMYPSGTESRRTFIKGWLTTYITVIVIAVIIVAIVLGLASCVVSRYYYY